MKPQRLKGHTWCLETWAVRSRWCLGTSFAGSIATQIGSSIPTQRTVGCGPWGWNIHHPSLVIAELNKIETMWVNTFSKKLFIQYVLKKIMDGFWKVMVFRVGPWLNAFFFHNFNSPWWLGFFFMEIGSTPASIWITNFVSSVLGAPCVWVEGLDRWNFVEFLGELGCLLAPETRAV